MALSFHDLHLMYDIFHLREMYLTNLSSVRVIGNALKRCAHCPTVQLSPIHLRIGFPQEVFWCARVFRPSSVSALNSDQKVNDQK